MKPCGKRFALLPVLCLLLLSQLSFAEVCLTDEEFQELQEIFGRLSTTLNAQETQIELLQTQLTTASEQQAKSLNQIEMLDLTLIELKQSLRQQNGVLIKSVILTAVLSAIVGFILGVSLTL